jgi:hypothetical protein
MLRQETIAATLDAARELRGRQLLEPPDTPVTNSGNFGPTPTFELKAHHRAILKYLGTKKQRANTSEVAKAISAKPSTIGKYLRAMVNWGLIHGERGLGGYELLPAGRDVLKRLK